MSTLSQFIGGSDVNRLKLKNGPYLDEISPPSSYSIRDFSAQNDHLMIITTDYKFYVGKKFNELIPCAPLDDNVFIPTAYNPGEYDVNIGGDPFPVDPSVATSAFSYQNNTFNEHIFWKSSNDIPIKSFYEDETGVAITNANGFKTNVTANLRSIIYSDGGSNKRLLHLNKSNSSSAYLHFYNDAQGTWDFQTYSYSGQTNVFTAATGNFFLDFSFSPSYLTIDPSTGNAVFMMSHFANGQSSLFKCVYNSTTAVIDITDVTTSGSISFSMNEIAVSSDGNTYVAAYALTPTTNYRVSTDGGSTWTAYDLGAVTGYNCKHIGYANGKFYTIAAKNTQNTRGVLLSTSTPQIPSSWQIEVIPGLEYPSILRDNKRGTACYISTGSFVTQYYESNTPKDERHIIKKIV